MLADEFFTTLTKSQEEYIAMDAITRGLTSDQVLALRLFIDQIVNLRSTYSEEVQIDARRSYTVEWWETVDPQQFFDSVKANLNFLKILTPYLEPKVLNLSILKHYSLVLDELDSNIKRLTPSTDHSLGFTEPNTIQLSLLNEIRDYIIYVWDLEFDALGYAKLPSVAEA